jgi:hypothetical protein
MVIDQKTYNPLPITCAYALVWSGLKMGLDLWFGKLRRKIKKNALPITISIGMILCKGDAVTNYQPPQPDPLSEIIDAFPSSEFRSMKDSLGQKKLALAIIADDDPNNATHGMEEMFQADFSDLQDYKLYTARADNFYGLFNQIRDYSLLKPIDALILAGHGNKDRISINPDERITTLNARQLFSGYSSLFSKDAVIILYSCSSGKGDNNLADAVSDALDRDAIAPRYTLIPETALPAEERAGEFVPDSSGRITFSCGTFRYYRNITFNEEGHTAAIATTSYETLNPGQASARDCGSYFLFLDKQLH